MFQQRRRQTCVLRIKSRTTKCRLGRWTDGKTRDFSQSQMQRWDVAIREQPRKRLRTARNWRRSPDLNEEAHLVCNSGHNRRNAATRRGDGISRRASQTALRQRLAHSPSRATVQNANRRVSRERQVPRAGEGERHACMRSTPTASARHCSGRRRARRRSPMAGPQNDTWGLLGIRQRLRNSGTLVNDRDAPPKRLRTAGQWRRSSALDGVAHLVCYPAHSRHCPATWRRDGISRRASQTATNRGVA